MNRFAAYGHVKRAMDPESRYSQWYLPLHIAYTAGFVSGAAVSLWLTPVELIKVRLQAKETSGQYSGVCCYSHSSHFLSHTSSSGRGCRLLEAECPE